MTQPGREEHFARPRSRTMASQTPPNLRFGVVLSIVVADFSDWGTASRNL